ncbi:MAG: M20/M25/M40 family metallo-hydrolase [Lentisphaeria bacterium]
MLETRELLARLVACRPVSADIPQVNTATRLLEAYLRKAGLHVAVEELPDGRHTLWAATVPGKQVQVLLNAHLDVVPAEDPRQFTLQEQDGWLLGRGSDDCLGNAALLANTLVRLCGRKVSAGALFSVDEEIGGRSTLAMVERGYGANKLVLVFDGRGYTLVHAQKGILTLKLIARGRAGHAAEPWLSDNAIDRLLAGYEKVKPLFPPVAPPDEWHNTLAATLLHAGTVTNRIPDRAEMTLNIRFIADGEAERLRQAIRDASGLEVEGTVECWPLVFAADDPTLQALHRSMEAGLGRAIEIRHINGATDARHFRTTSVPVAILGLPGRGGHGPHEAIECSGLAAYERWLLNYLETEAAG